MYFQRDCIFANWDPVLQEEDPTLAWDLFLVILSNLLDKHAPLKKMVIHENLPEWMTREYLETANDRDYWLNKQRSSPDDPIINMTCINYKRITRVMKRNLKRDFFPGCT